MLWFEVGWFSFGFGLFWVFLEFCLVFVLGFIIIIIYFIYYLFLYCIYFIRRPCLLRVMLINLAFLAMVSRHLQKQVPGAHRFSCELLKSTATGSIE